MADFETLPENVDLLTSKVTPPDHKVTLLQVAFFQSLRACQKHIKDLNSMKLAGCNTDIGIYDLHISDVLQGVSQITLQTQSAISPEIMRVFPRKFHCITGRSYLTTY